MKGLVAEVTTNRSCQPARGGYFRPDAGTGPAVVEEKEPGKVKRDRGKVGGGADRGRYGVGPA